MSGEKLISHFCHQHPLILRENSNNREPDLDCYACDKPIVELESVYMCENYKYCINKETSILHKTCAELPKQISHPSHPQHPLHLFQDQQYPSYSCNLCRRRFTSVLRYRCHSCDFDVEITCEKLGMEEMFGEASLAHVNHIHPLRLVRKPAFLFSCDGCGTQDWDMAYTCSACDFWVHKTCALLPASLRTDRHHHWLTMAFCFPIEHRRYRYQCGVCDKNFNTACWVYFCGDCRYFAHLKCVTSTAAETTQGDIEEVDTDVIEFPIYAHDISKELITPFVMREKGLNKIPDVTDMATTVNMAETTAKFSFLFNYHKHPLSLVAEEDHNRIMDKEAEDEAENDGEVKICDVCVTPITSPPYYECSVAAAACKYFVHSICYFLPKTLSSLELYGDCPKTHDKNHRFTLYTSSEFTDMDCWLFQCELCEIFTNGRVYECEGCKMTIDVKCASLPTTIRHASHHHHKRLVLNRIPPQEEGGKRKRKCHGCGSILSNCIAYCCSSDDCDFALNLKCAMLPKSIRKHEWDTTHSLPLTFDASLDHPSDFFCDFCEDELHPKMWMYHCRQCDLSFHLFCLMTASGWYRNIKFGRRFVLDGLHPNHPLTFNCVTLKKRCDICHLDVYGYGGLECASCNYLVCLPCARRELRNM